MKVIALSIIFSLLGATYSFPAEVNLDRIPMSKTKFDFLSLYKSQWELFGIPKKLRQAVDDAFTEQTEPLMWGTMRMQLASNYDNIHEKI